MRKAINLIILFVLLTAIWPLQSQALSTRETVLQLLKDYSPDSYYMVDQYMKMPEVTEKYFNGKKIEFKFPKGDFIHYIKGDSEQDILNSIGIMVHEMCHFYTNNLAYQLFKENGIKIAISETYDAYYIGDQVNILVKYGKVFNTTEIAAVIPESLRTYHYKTYISPDSRDVASKTLGAYGLLNEFNAYYYGTKTAFDMYPYYRDKMATDAGRWADYMGLVNLHYFAYPEFKFYILKYLQYAQKNHPEIYQEIITNREFCQAFLMVDQKYGQLIQDYFTLRNEIFESLRQEGYTVDIDPTSYSITRSTPKFTRLGGDYFITTYELLQNELAKEEYEDVLKELRRLQ